MDSLYAEDILDHYKHPRNFGQLDHPDIHVEANNPLCGDRLAMDMMVKDGVVEDVAFSGQGCAISQASASLLTDELRGMPVEAAKAYSKEDLLELIGIPLSKNPTRLKCALLSLKALKSCEE